MSILRAIAQQAVVEFQSLTWVERLSDADDDLAGYVVARVSIPHLG